MGDTPELPDKCPACGSDGTEGHDPPSVFTYEGRCVQCKAFWWWHLLQEARRELDTTRGQLQSAMQGSDLRRDGMMSAQAERNAAIARAEKADLVLRGCMDELNNTADGWAAKRRWATLWKRAAKMFYVCERTGQRKVVKMRAERDQLRAENERLCRFAVYVAKCMPDDSTIATRARAALAETGK